MATAMGEAPCRAILKHQLVGHGGGNSLEEIQIEIGLVPVAIEGYPHRIHTPPPQLRIHLAPEPGIEFYARLGDARPSRFAFLRFSAVNVAKKASKDRTLD